MPDLRPTKKPWTKAKPGAVLAVSNSYEETLGALRRRKEALGFTNLEIDERMGLAAGHWDKIFGPRRRLNLGPLTWGLCLAALGLKIALVVDQNPIPTTPKNYSKIDRAGGRANPAVGNHRLTDPPKLIEEKRHEITRRNHSPTWTGNASHQTDQFRRNAFSKLLRDIADRLQNGGGGTEQDVTFEREELSATYRLKTSAHAAPAKVA